VAWLRRKKTPQFFSKLLKIPGLTFPYDENFPASFAQLSEITFVAFNISLAFVLPKFFVCGRLDFSTLATVYMPETTMNEDYLFVPDHYKVRVTGQVTTMQGIAITHSMNKRTHDYFRRSILGPNLRHIEGPLLFGKNINHDYSMTPPVRQRFIAGSRCSSKKASNDITLG
jgi:hypothetical protein